MKNMRKLTMSGLLICVLAVLLASSASAIVIAPPVVPEMGGMMNGMGAVADFTVDASMYELGSDGKSWVLSAPVDFGDAWGNGMADVELLSALFDPDPVVENNYLVKNISGMTQTFTITTILPTTFSAPNKIQGNLALSIIGEDGAMSAVSGSSIYTALIDGSSVWTLRDDPYTLSFPGFSSAVSNTGFSFQPSATPVNSSIGITLQFTLSPGDTASILSNFEVTPEPGTLAMYLLGGIGLAISRRRFRR